MEYSTKTKSVHIPKMEFEIKKSNEIAKKIQDSLGMSVVSNGFILCNLCRSISVERLLYALQMCFSKRNFTQETSILHVSAEKNGYKFSSNGGTMIVMPESTALTGHPLQISWQEKSADYTTVYEFDNDTALRRVEWKFSLPESTAWVTEGYYHRGSANEARRTVIVTIEGLVKSNNGRVEIEFVSDEALTIHKAHSIVNVLEKTDFSAFNMTGLYVLIRKVDRFLPISNFFRIDATMGNNQYFRSIHENGLIKEFSIKTRGTVYSYFGDIKYSAEKEDGTKVQVENGTITCKGKRGISAPFEEMLDSVEKIVVDVYGLRFF
jgi:hypothetical protein